MTSEKLFSFISQLNLELSRLHNIYWLYQANLKTEEDLIIAYNIFRSRYSTICEGED